MRRISNALAVFQSLGNRLFYEVVILVDSRRNFLMHCRCRWNFLMHCRPLMLNPQSWSSRGFAGSLEANNGSDLLDGGDNFIVSSGTGSIPGLSRAGVVIVVGVRRHPRLAFGQTLNPNRTTSINLSFPVFKLISANKTTVDLSGCV